MLLVILAGLTVVATGILVLGRRGHQRQRADDLGTVSQGWIANHRASAYDSNR